MKITIYIYFLLLLILTAAAGCKDMGHNSVYQEPDIKLEGYWKFSIGDDSSRAKAEYDDTGWEEIFVPSPWEDEGFHGYDGYAWYRKHFTIPAEYANSALYIDLGFIDDVDETYLNGRLIGYSGTFPPDYVTAYSAQRKYPLPPGYINFGGENVISVRVYDSQLGGGISSGLIGVFRTKDMAIPEQIFTSEWKFQTGDESDWKEPDYNDSGWDQLKVPGFWEHQGYADYDGFAWYRKSFTIDDNLKDKQLVLLLGKVDDFDEVYVNGVKAGSTGKWKNGEPVQPLEDYYTRNRIYYIPEGVLNRDGINTIAVRVYDGFIDGGIYGGFPGLISRETYNKLKN